MYAWVYVCENASTNRPDIERCYMQIVVTKKATYRISIEHTATKVEHVTIQSFDMIDSKLNLSIDGGYISLFF